MANMYDIRSLSYTAHDNTEWFTRAMFGGRLIQEGKIRVLTGIKGDELLSMIDLQNKVLQIDGKDCAWTPNQIIKLSEKTARVKTYKINLEQCIDELEHKRTLYQLSPGAKNDSLPDELEEATLHLLAIALSNEIEEMIVGGDESKDPNQFDGMEKLLTNSKEAVKRKGGVLTKANVLEAVEAVYRAVPEDVLQSEDAETLFCMGSYNARRLIREALADKNNQVIAASWTVDDSDKRNPKMYYLGMEFIPAKGIGKNTLIAYDSGNAFMLTDLLGDAEELRLGQFPAPNDSKIFIDGRLRLGFVIPFEDEMVIYSDKITADQDGGPADKGLTVLPNSLVFHAEGETKVFNIYTASGVEPELGDTPEGYEVTKEATQTLNGANVTPVTVKVEGNTGNLSPRVGEIRVNLPDSDRTTTITLNQRTEDIDQVMP